MRINYSEFHFNEAEALYYDEEFIADFNICVVDKKISLGLSKARGKPSYLVEVTYTDGRPKRSEWTDNLKNMDLFALFEIDDSFFPSESRKLLLSKLMHEAGQIPERFVINSCEGLQEISEVPVYVFGEYKFSYGELSRAYEVVTHHTVGNVRFTERKIVELCMPYIKLLPGVSEILFFDVLFAVVKPFLSQIGISCGFLLSLVAPSGHLKTTLARLYALWLNPSSVQETSFYSLQRDQVILDSIGSLSGQNFLIDDLHKIQNANERNRQERRLDVVSRYVNDKPGCANVILTGETMEKMGIFSCMDRIFQVSIPKMDAKQIETLKGRISALPPGLMPSVAIIFARSLMDNYPDVLKDIQAFYDKNSINHAVAGCATRVYRHAVFIRLTEYLFRKYVLDPEMMVLRNEKDLSDALLKQIRLQEAELQKIRALEEPCDYIAEFYEIIKAGDRYIRICTNPVEYGRSKIACHLDHGMICITTSSLKEAFFKRCGKCVAPKLVIDAFHREGILEEEPGSKGRQKNHLGQKHYFINLRYLVSYLCQNSYPVSQEHYEKYMNRP